MDNKLKHKKTLYVEFKSLLKPWKFYTTAGRDGRDIFQVWKGESHHDPERLANGRSPLNIIASDGTHTRLTDVAT